MKLSRLPRLIFAFALLAIMLRAMVPAGYMPNLHQVSGNGADGFSMVICTASGPETITLDDKFKPVSEKPAHAEMQKCEFSLLSHTPFDAAIHADFAHAAVFDENTSSQFVLNDAVRSAMVRLIAQPRAPPVLI